MNSSIPSSIHLNIITPEKILFSEQAEMVTVPGVDGEFAVLAGHLPLISLINSGTISVYINNKIVKEIFVTDGVAEVVPNECNIMAEYAIDINDINENELSLNIKNLQEDLQKTSHEHDKVVLEKKIFIAEKMLKCKKRLA